MTTDPNRAPAPAPTRWQRFRDATALWRLPALAGAAGSAFAWLIWYYSKVPCLAERAAEGFCNPGLLAKFITLPALTSILGIGAGFATLAGGYNYAMFNKAMKRADDAESRLQYERQLRDEEREQEKAERQQEKAERQQEKAERERMQERYEQRIDELLAALAEERRQAAATQQAMTDAINRLLEQRQNGSARNSDSDLAESQ